MATEIPASITTPDSAETRLGTLRCFDGFPDDATVRTAYDNLDFQRAVEVFLSAMPAASMSAMSVPSTPMSLHRFDLAGPPCSVEPWLEGGVQAERHEPPFAGDGLDPVGHLAR
jgi:hypothetical protein